MADECKLLKKFTKRKIRYVEEPSAMINPVTKKQLKVTTLNLPVSEQIALGGLYRKGYISGHILGKGKLTEKGKKALTKCKR